MPTIVPFQFSLVLACGVLAGTSGAAAAAELAPTRSTPAEYAQVAAQGATTGTSGVTGIRTRVLAGDPTQPGLYTILLEVPANTRIEAHTHPDARVATVVRGTWHFGYGAHFDPAALKALEPGSFYTEPAGQAHFARTGDTAVAVMITGIGPSGTTYTAATPSPAK